MTEAKKELGVYEEYALDIREEYNNGMALAKRSVESMLNVGKYLDEVRQLFKGDKEFGQWRAEAIPEISSRMATNLMGVWRKFGGKETNLSISAMSELLPASDELVEEVVQESHSNPFTVAEIRSKVREAKKATKKATDATDVQEEKPKLTMNRVGAKPAPKPQLSLEEKAQQIIDLPTAQRVKRSNDPWVIMGFTPFIDGLHNRDVMELVYSIRCKEAKGDVKVINALEEAYYQLCELYDDV